MSITVRDCLNTAALRDAEVVAGKNGLDRIVASVSVVEDARSYALVDEVFVGNEIMISAFASIKDSIKEQCMTIERLHITGNVGLIIYYVGIYLERIDEQVINVANRLNFPIICMPSGKMDYRYSEAISSIMKLIIDDRNENGVQRADILDSVSQLNERMRTAKSILRILSDTMGCTCYIADSMMNYIESASWPLSASDEAVFYFEKYREVCCFPFVNQMVQIRDDDGNDLYFFDFEINAENRPKMYFIVSGEELPQIGLMKISAEVLQTVIKMWKMDFEGETPSALVHALFDSSSSSVYSLAERLKINLRKYDGLWMIFDLAGTADKKKKKKMLALTDAVRGFMEEYQGIAMVDIYYDVIIAIVDNDSLMMDEEHIISSFLEYVEGKNTDRILLYTATEINALETAKEAYSLVTENIEYAQRVFPSKVRYSFADLAFTSECVRISKDMAQYEENRKVIKSLVGRKDSVDLIETLSTYLIDADESMEKTAELLFLSKSTIKYRMRKIREIIGEHCLDLPYKYYIYRALAIERIKENL
jgi:hypothetical protein